MPAPQSVQYRRQSGRGTNKQRERIIQRSLTVWLREFYPHVDFYNDWASGAFLTAGQNKSRVSLSSYNGWVDLFIAEPSRGFHGLFIELKKEGVRPFLKNGNISSNPQIKKEWEFIKRKTNQGYWAQFASGLEEAQTVIDWYFENEKPEPMELF